MERASPNLESKLTNNGWENGVIVEIQSETGTSPTPAGNWVSAEYT
jgi:hypothetical protein